MVRGGSRAAATSKMECFVIIVNGFQPLTIITKRSILDVAAALDSLLVVEFGCMDWTARPWFEFIIQIHHNKNLYRILEMSPMIEAGHQLEN